MAVAFRSAAGTNFVTANTITLSEPAGATTDDILIATVYHEGGSGVTITPVAAWNLISRIDQAGGGPITQATYWFRRTGSAPSYKFDLSSSVVVSGGVVAYSGCVTTGDPQDVVASTNSNTGSGTITCTGITTTTDKCMIVGTATSFTFTAASSTDFANERLDGDANKATYFYDDGLLTPAGATGNLTITRSSGTDAWAGVLIALKPPIPPTTITGLSSVTTTAPSISAVNLTSGSDTTDDADSVTDSISPSPNKLILLSISARADAVQPTISSISGCGLTWVEIDHSDYDASGSRRTLFLYRAMGSSPSSGAVTITFGATQTAKSWSIDEISNIDTSGTNGSGAIVQSAKNTGASVTSLSVTLAAFSNTSNATFGAFGNAGEGDLTQGSGFTRLSNQQVAGECGTATEFVSTNDTSVDMSNSTMDIGGIAIEIKNAFPSAMVWVV